MKSIQDRLGECKLPSAQQKCLQNTLSYTQQEADHFLGYPCTRVFDYSALYPFLSLPINNVGDPFLESNYHLNTHEYEREVIGFFAKLLHGDLDNLWGYVTNGRLNAFRRRTMKQLSIIAKNRLGVVSETLAAGNVNIESLDAGKSVNCSVIVLTVDHYERALQRLHKLPELRIITEDAILVKLVNEPGALAKIARRFTDAGIGLRSIRFLERNNDYGLVAISTDRTEAALALVGDVLVS